MYVKCVKHAYRRHYLRRTQKSFRRSFLQERLGFVSLFEIKSIFWHQNPKISRVILHRKGRSHHTIPPNPLSLRPRWTWRHPPPRGQRIRTPRCWKGGGNSPRERKPGNGATVGFGGTARRRFRRQERGGPPAACWRQ